MSLAPEVPPDAPPHPSPRDRVQLRGSTIGPSLTMVSAIGEVDAANASALSRFVEARLDSATRLILDLRLLDFFGTQGFSILHRINVTCSRLGISWAVVAGAEVRRVLRICDPDGGLPTAGSLEGAMATVMRPPPNHLRVVSGG